MSTDDSTDIPLRSSVPLSRLPYMVSTRRAVRLLMSRGSDIIVFGIDACEFCVAGHVKFRQLVLAKLQHGEFRSVRQVDCGQALAFDSQSRQSSAYIAATVESPRREGHTLVGVGLHIVYGVHFVADFHLEVSVGSAEVYYHFLVLAVECQRRVGCSLAYIFISAYIDAAPITRGLPAMSVASCSPSVDVPASINSLPALRLQSAEASAASVRR